MCVIILPTGFPVDSSIWWEDHGFLNIYINLRLYDLLCPWTSCLTFFCPKCLVCEMGILACILCWERQFSTTKEETILPHSWQAKFSHCHRSGSLQPEMFSAFKDSCDPLGSTGITQGHLPTSRSSITSAT